jgi:hypothetical protein
MELTSVVYTQVEEVVEVLLQLEYKILDLEEQ